MEIKRAYSLLQLKSVNEDRRELVGIATTPTPDHVGDVVDAKGAEFQLPIPLLWQHSHREPIGEVYAASVTSAGIEVKARIAKVNDAGKLKDRLDESWHSVKNRLVKGLSIGFRGLAHTPLATGGVHWKRWRWIELSAVTIPMNSEATITAVKRFAMAQRQEPFFYLTEKWWAQAKDKSTVPPFLAQLTVEQVLVIGRSKTYAEYRAVQERHL